MDSDGFTFYKGRIKRMIICSGYNVYPSHVESVIETHRAVLQCTVVGMPHPYKKEVPKAFIVLKNKRRKKDLITLELKLLCKKNLPKYAWPVSYEYMESLPSTRVGKIDFAKLQNDAIKDKEYEENNK